MPTRSTSTARPSVPRPGRRYAATGLDVWTMMNQVSASVDAVNLGQGYMSFPPKDFIKRAAQDALAENSHNQYSPPRGRPALLAQLSQYFSGRLGRQIDAGTEVSVHAGANEALLSAFTAFLEPGKNEEVILIEPAFDQYTPNVVMAGGRPVYVPLRVCTSKNPEKEVISSGEWRLDMGELEAAITDKTRILVLNTPHNPVGKVFTRAELADISAVAQRHGLLVVADEVYEHLTYGAEHVSIATLPGMWERTITVGSAGKLFGVTGWRVGWAIGPAELIGPTLAAHTHIVFTSNTPLQEGTAATFAQAATNGFVATQRQEYERRRNRLMAIFDDVGLPYTVPDGAYYLLVNAAAIQIPKDYEFPPDIATRGDNFKLVYFFVKEFGVSGIPPTEFYSDAHKPLAKDYIRFAFCKTDQGLEDAAQRLKKLKQYLQGP
ncbi:arylformamidase [Coemansia sp. RSA 552]|nr:arylformamidase [Coemansia sp. RSA 552]